MECVGRDQRNGLRDHTRGSTTIHRAAVPASKAAVPYRISLERLVVFHRSVHVAMMTKKRSKVNHDPSRALVRDDAGIPVAGRGDRAALPGSVDAGDWPGGADEAGLGCGNAGCSSVVRGHNVNREKMSPGSCWPGKSAEVEQLRRRLPSALVGG